MSHYPFIRFDARNKRIPDRIVDRPHIEQPVREDCVSRQTYRLACRLASKGRIS